METKEELIAKLSDLFFHEDYLWKCVVSIIDEFIGKITFSYNDDSQTLFDIFWAT